MHAHVALLSKIETLSIEDRPVADPAPDEVLIRVKQCGICGSDLKMYSGTHPVLKPPMVLGHEFFGTVEAVGTPGDVGPGDLVTVFPPVGCGHCYNCDRGRPHLCATMELIGGQRQGGLSELVSVPAANVLTVDPAVPAERRVLIEPLAVGVHAASCGRVEAGERVVIIGAGPIGLFTALALKHRGVEGVILADLSESRLRLARELGAGTVVNSGATPLLDYVHEHVRPEGVDVAYECVGTAATAAQALDITTKGGRAVLVGLSPAKVEFNGVDLQRGERTLIGVQMYTREDFHESMEILAGDVIPDHPDLVEAYALGDVARAFSALKSGELRSLKAFVRMEGPS